MTAAVPPEALDVISAAATATGHIRPVPDRGADDLQGALAEVDFLVLDHERDDIRAILGQLPRLQVVQIMTAGTDWITPALPHRVTLCTASGSRDVPVAEWVLAALFGASTGLLESVRTQSAAHWEHFRHDEVTDKVVLILGLGSIGRAVQIRLQALGAEVIGIARTPREGVHSLQEFPELLGRADALVVLAPLTEQTKGIVDAAMLSRLRDGALVVNAGRGGVIDTPALLAELQAGRIRAVLDVVDPEPLPADHPLWSAPGVFISPHIAGDSGASAIRAWELAGTQLRRYLAGESLLNVVVDGSLRGATL